MTRRGGRSHEVRMACLMEGRERPPGDFLDRQNLGCKLFTVLGRQRKDPYVDSLGKSALLPGMSLWVVSVRRVGNTQTQHVRSAEHGRTGELRAQPHRTAGSPGLRQMRQEHSQCSV